MKSAGIILPLLCTAAVLSAQTATYTNSNQTVTLTGLGASNGVGQSRVSWGTCNYDGSQTVCNVTAPYTGVGGPGTITITLAYGGNGTSPIVANSISPGSDFVTFGLLPGGSGSIAVALTNKSGITTKFLSNNFNFFYDNSAVCAGPAVTSCAVGQVGLTPGASITGAIHGAFDATPQVQSVISASAYGGFGALAPATWMEIYGANLANVASQTWSGADFNGNKAPTALGGTTVTIGGKPAFIDYVSPTQVNAQVPSDVPLGSQPVIVTTPGGTSVGSNITVANTQPGLLAPAVFKFPAGQYVAALFPDGVTFVMPPGTLGGVPGARAKPGNTIIFYGVGFGTVTPAIPAGEIVSQTNRLGADFQISFAGTPAAVSFSGLTAGFLGLYQFNVVVPNVPASDTVPVTFTLGGVAGTQKLIIPISN